MGFDNKIYQKQYRDKNKERIKQYWEDYRKNNKQKIKENQKRYSDANKEKITKRHQAYAQNNPEKVKKAKMAYANTEKGIRKKRNATLKHRFGITIDQFEQMQMDQNNLCAICNLPETAPHQSGKIKNLAIDHCHKTGKVRGLLCTNCNRGIGHLRESLELLQKAMEYIKKHNELD